MLFFMHLEVTYLLQKQREKGSPQGWENAIPTPLRGVHVSKCATKQPYSIPMWPLPPTILLAAQPFLLHLPGPLDLHNAHEKDPLTNKIPTSNPKQSSTRTVTEMPPPSQPHMWSRRDTRLLLRTQLHIMPDRFWLCVDGFVLFTGYCGVEPTHAIGFCIIPYLGIWWLTHVKNNEQSCLVFCFRVLYTCRSDGDRRRSVDDSLLHPISYCHTAGVDINAMTFNKWQCHSLLDCASLLILFKKRLLS